MIKRHLFTIGAITIAVAFWFADSAIHYFVYDEHELEFLPADFNELWMRALIVVLLVSFGAFADYRSSVEKRDVYDAMLDATHHILKNFLQKMLLFRQEAEDSTDFGSDVLEQYDQMISDTQAQIKNLEDIRDPSRRIIEGRYRPR